MQAEEGSGFQRRKEELEQKIKALEEERVSLMNEVEALRQRRTLLELERKSKMLEETVDVLRKQKDDLQGEVSEMGSSQPAEGQTQ
jgi:uncharacterized coiled-coil DUF342 family protein